MTFVSKQFHTLGRFSPGHGRAPGWFAFTVCIVVVCFQHVVLSKGSCTRQAANTLCFPRIIVPNRQPNCYTGIGQPSDG